MKEPKQECAFQNEWSEENDAWECQIIKAGNDNVYCNKSICPFWKDQKVTVDIKKSEAEGKSEFE